MHSSIKLNEMNLHHLFSLFRGKKYTFYKQSSKRIEFRPEQRTIPSVIHLDVQSEETAKNCQYYFPSTTKLTFYENFKPTHQCLLTLLKSIIPLNKLTALAMFSAELCIEEFFKLLIASPHIQTLVFFGQSTVKINALLSQPTETFRLATDHNRITNVDVQRRNLIENIQFLIRLCPRMQQLTIEVHKSEIETVVQSVLSKTKSYLRHLNLVCMKNTSRLDLRKVKNLIERKELLDRYSIKRINKTLYLWL